MLVFNKGRSHGTVVVRGMGFRKVVSQVSLTGAPENRVITARYTIADPIIAHVDRLRAL